MSRTSIVIASAVTLLLIMGATLAQGSFGGADEPTARPATPTETAQPEETTKPQDEQLEAAIEELRDDTARYSDRHQLVLTIRDEPPLDIWRADGSGCVIDGVAPVIEILRNDGTQLQAPSDVPPRAQLFADGACEATTTVAVEDETTYYVAIKLPGRDSPRTTAVVREDSPQQVTLSR